jgi:hypothetical protein
VAAGRDVAGRWIVATDRALLGHAEAAGAVLRLDWSRIVRATWSDGVLEVLGAAGDGPASRWRFRVASGRVVEAVRALVTSALVWSQRIEGEGRRAWVAAHRGADGVVVWTVMMDAGSDDGSPEARAWAEAELGRIRAQTGL